METATPSPPKPRRSLLLGIAMAEVVVQTMAADLTLFEFGEQFDPGVAVATDARISRVRSGSAASLHVETGHAQSWPGVALPAPGGRWDLSRYGFITVPVKNAGTNRVTVHCRVDNPGADGTDHCLTRSATIDPGRDESIRIDLKRTGEGQLGGRLFGMRGYPAAYGGRGAIDVTQVTQLLFFVGKPEADHVFEIGAIRATGTYTAPTASVTDAEPFFPFIDSFGQYIHQDWPGKVKSTADLEARRNQEKQELASQPGPAEWDAYGGWAAGPKLQATGFFRTEKRQSKWWLVDPDGRLFWSHGIDCVRMFDATPVDERSTWFKDFPGEQAELASFIVPSAYALKGHYAGRSPRSY